VGESERVDLEPVSPLVRRLGRILGPLLFVAILGTPSDVLDPAQRKVAAVTVLTAVYWITSALPLGATSLIPAALLPLTGAVRAETIAPFYMGDIVLLFLGAMLLALGLERWGVHRRAALVVLSLFGSRPRGLVLGFMAATAFLSLWLNNTATALLMMPIANAVIVSLSVGSERAQSAFATALLLGVAYSASVGGMGTPVGTAPNQIFLSQFREQFPRAPEISFGAWCLAWLPVVILYLPLGWWLLTRFALRVPPGGPASDAIERERAALGPPTSGEKRMAALFALTALLWVTRSGLEIGSWRIPGWASLLAPGEPGSPSFASDATVALAMALAGFVLPGEGARGRRLLDWELARSMPWDVLLLIGGGLAIAGAFHESGLDRVVGQALGSSLAGASSLAGVALLVAAVVLLSEIASNTAITALLMPILGSAALGAGLSPLALMIPATLAASAGFMLPVATPPNAVAFATGRVRAATMARVGLWMDILLVLLVALVFELWGRVVFGIEDGLPDWAEP
jgi:sodium-dependent dicarboxylate transporter 2/3/5